MQRSPAAEALHHALKQVEARKLVACPLQEEHGNLDRREMLGTLDSRPAGSMQRKAKEDEPADPWQRPVGLRLRGHASAERLSTGEERQAGSLACGLPHRIADRRLGHG